MFRVKETVNLSSTQRFIDLLSNINHEIAYKLVEIIKYRENCTVSYFDFGDKNDSVSYVTANKVIELMDKHGDDYKTLVWSSNRTPAKIGKVVKMIFNDYYPVNQPKDVEAPKPKNDIESFVNMYKAERDKNKNYDKFEIVKGEDIRFWYNQDNYSRFLQEGSSLAKSCLRYKECGKFLDIYVDNPDKVSMLILKDDANRLRSRAILWNLDKPYGRVFMDRIYTMNDFDVELFKNYARENGWLFKSRQTYGYNHNTIDGVDGQEYNWDNFIMEVSLKKRKTNYKYYPYIDTLCVFNREEFVLSNQGNLLRKPPYIKLTSPEGGFIDEADYRDMVFSNYHEEEIPREEAEFVTLDQDWVFRDDVIYVHNTNGKTSHVNSPLIVQSKIKDKIKYFIKEDCLFSDFHNTYIYKDSAIEVYIDEEKTNKIITHKRLMSNFFKKDSKGDFVKKSEINLEEVGFIKKEEVKVRYKNPWYNIPLDLSGIIDNTDNNNLLWTSIPSYGEIRLSNFGVSSRSTSEEQSPNPVFIPVDYDNVFGYGGRANNTSLDTPSEEVSHNIRSTRRNRGRVVPIRVASDDENNETSNAF